MWELTLERNHFPVTFVRSHFQERVTWKHIKSHTLENVNIHALFARNHSHTSIILSSIQRPTQAKAWITSISCDISRKYFVKKEPVIKWQIVVHESKVVLIITVHAFDVKSNQIQHDLQFYSCEKGQCNEPILLSFVDAMTRFNWLFMSCFLVGLIIVLPSTYPTRTAPITLRSIYYPENWTFNTIDKIILVLVFYPHCRMRTITFH